MPVVLRLGRGDDTSLHRLLLSDAEAVLELDHDPDWIVGNHDGNGFYRVELSDDDLAAVAARALADLSPLERYGLVEDEWARVLAGRGSVARVLGLLRSLAADDDLSVWQRIGGVLGALDRAGGDDNHEAFAGWVRALAGPALRALGDRPAAGESERTTALRASLFDTTSRVGDDEQQRALAAAHFAALGDDPAAVDPDLADAVVRVVAADADEETWAQLRERAAAARTPQERLRHQGALADTTDTDLVLRFCSLVLTDEVRTQDGLFLLRRALANRAAQPLVWAFVVDHWADITSRFPSQSVPRLLEGIRTIGDRALAEQVVAFLDDHPVPQGAQVLRQHVERMWVSVALAERIPAELAAALA